MCGIAGILHLDGRPVAPERVRAMTDAIAHRGPDDEGFYFGAGVGLGMRRLAIIDLETGRQPIASEDGSVVVVLNGEIYNFRELRRRLEARGHRFATATDTEVIVHLYEELGDRCVDELRGMFAFALWDVRRRRLLLARDRFGIKPLHWARIGDSLVFASEVKAILELPEVPVELNWGSVEHLFTFLTTPPAETIVEGVHKLEPGRLLTASAREGVSVRRWWRLEFEPDDRPSEAEWAEALREALDESVRLHRVADVPLGAFLSGGVDSSAVVESLARGGSEPVSTFSIGFREHDFDELEYARLAARAFGTRHREEVVEPEVVDVLDELAWYLDEPFGDSSAIPTWMVSKITAEDVTVALSGDGGDELFAGYDRYRVERRERLNRLIPPPLRRLIGAVGESLPEGATGREMLRHLSKVGVDRYLDATTLFRDDRRKRLFSPAALRRMPLDGPREALGALEALDSPRGHWLSRLQRLDLEGYLPLDILTKVDRMSMAHSLEARVPLLDHRFVELAARIPPRLQMRRGRAKYIFKEALSGRVPEPILDRPKRGFAIPLGGWFRGALGGFVRELLLGETSRRRGVFRPAYLEELLARHEGGRSYDLELWTLISFELWCRVFLDRRAGVSGEPQPPPAGADRRAGRSSVLKPALLLTSGRTLAFGASFFIPVVLARVFSTAEFGTYKQLFLLIMTLYFTVQLGIANSLYYFVPREPERAGRFVANAFAVLAAAGLVCAGVLVVERDLLAWLFSNEAVPAFAVGVAAYLVLMLLATPLEIVMIARRRHRSATVSYALSDVVRAGMLIVPTLLTGELFWMMAGAVAFAFLRFGAAALWLRRELRGELRLDRSLLRRQLAYSLPFGLAVVVITVQADLHQYVVAHTFDAATFAIYAVGCLQIPLVDFIATPTGDVMMVRMAEELRDGDAEGARMTWHDAMRGLALLLFPLVGGLVLVAPELIPLLFTEDYAASVPIFMLWTTMILFAPFLVDGVLRVHARTRLLLGLSAVQLALIAAMIVPFLSWFGLPGAVLATVLALATARIAGLARIRRLLGLPLARLLPWRTLALIAAAAALAYAAGRAAGAAAAALPDLPSMLLAGAVYAAVYGALARWWGVAPDPRPALRRALGKLSPRLAGS